MGGLGDFFSALKNVAVAGTNTVIGAFAPATTAIKSSLTSSITTPAVSTKKMPVLSQAQSIFQGVASGLGQVFAPTPKSSPKKAGIVESIVNTAGQIVFGQKNPSTGLMEGGLITSWLDRKTAPPATNTVVLTPAVTQPAPPGTGVTVLREQSQPNGLFSVGFPAPPPSSSTTEINVAGSPAAQAAGVPIWVWLIVALAALVFALRRK